MAKEENIIIPALVGLGLVILLSRSEPDAPVIPPSTSISKTPVNFIREYWDEALLTQRDTGISALFTIAQAGLESGWGNNAPRFNFFGIKDSASWKGPTQVLTTREFVNGRWITTRARFRAYSNARQSFMDHGKFFFENPRYRNALPVRGDAIKFARAIHKAGYATDPNYSDKLINIMKIVVTVLQRYDLI